MQRIPALERLGRMRDWANHLPNRALYDGVQQDGGGRAAAALPLPYGVGQHVNDAPVARSPMTHRPENRNEMPRARDGRRRELRELLVSAANAARVTRQAALAVTLRRTSRRAVRERMSAFLAAVR